MVVIVMIIPNQKFLSIKVVEIILEDSLKPYICLHIRITIFGNPLNFGTIKVCEHRKKYDYNIQNLCFELYVDTT